MCPQVSGIEGLKSHYLLGPINQGLVYSSITVPVYTRGIFLFVEFSYFGHSNYSDSLSDRDIFPMAVQQP